MSALGLTIEELYKRAKAQGWEKKVLEFPLLDEDCNNYGEQVVSDFYLNEYDSRFVTVE